MSFKERFCAHFGCKPEEYERRLLFSCFYWHASLLGKLFWYIDKRFYAEDIALIQVLAVTRDSGELKREIANYRFEHPPRGLLHGYLKFRFSGRKALQLADELFGNSKAVLMPTTKSEPVNKITSASIV